MFRFKEASSERELLERVSAPWRTQAQLRRLADRPRPRSDTFSFAVLGDVEPGRFWIFRTLFNRKGVFARQLSAIQEQSVDFSVQLGDMVSRGLPRQYLGFFRQLEGLTVVKPYLTVIGNHDRAWPHGRAHSRDYRRLLGPNNYLFDHGGVRFIVVDSSLKRLTRSQLKWLSLALQTPLRKVVFTHIPPAVLRLWGRAAMQRLGGFTQGAEEFARLMTRHHVERVYMGHVHGFGVQDLGGVRYVLSGGGGSPLFPCGPSDRFHHYLTVTVGPRGLSERVHSLDGSTFLIPPGKVLL